MPPFDDINEVEINLGREVRIVRDRRQELVANWVAATFGADVTLKERGARFVEEALELGQALGLSISDIEGLAGRVYSRPPGRSDKEVGDVSVTLLSVCQMLGVSADGLETRGIENALSKEKEHHLASWAEKAEQGLVYRGALS